MKQLTRDDILACLNAVGPARIDPADVLALFERAEAAEKQLADHGPGKHCSRCDRFLDLERERDALRDLAERAEGYAKAFQETMEEQRSIGDALAAQVAAQVAALQSVRLNGNYIDGDDVELHDSQIDAALAASEPEGE